MYCSPNRRPTLDQIIDIDSFSANDHSEKLGTVANFVMRHLICW